jgi:hypothetical protein
MSLAEQFPQVNTWLQLSELAIVQAGSENQKIFLEPELDQLVQNGIDLVWFLDGHWHLLDTHPAWYGNESHKSLTVFSWAAPGDDRRLVVMNNAGHRSQCYVSLPWNDLAGRTWRLQGRLGLEVYHRDGDDLAARGLYLDLPAWGCQAFALETV